MLIHWANVNLILGLFLFFANTLLGQQAVLQGESSSLQLEIIPFPVADQSNLYLVHWRGLEAGKPDGVGVFEKSKGAGEVRYTFIGNEGPLYFADRSEKLLRNGSQVPAFQVFRPKALKPELAYAIGESPQPQKLFSAYRDQQGLDLSSQSKDAIQKVIDLAATNLGKVCQSRARLEIKWNEFEKAKRLAWAGQAAGVINGLVEKSEDPPYREEICKITDYSFGWNTAAANGLSFERKGASLNVKFGPTGFNPKQQAIHWANKDF